MSAAGCLIWARVDTGRLGCLGHLWASFWACDGLCAVGIRGHFDLSRWARPPAPAGQCHCKWTPVHIADLAWQHLAGVDDHPGMIIVRKILLGASK